MKIHFERTGGFSAAMRREVTLDSTALPPQKAQELGDLVRSADLFSLPGKVAAPRGAADTCQYKLRVEHEGKEHTIQLDQTAVPAKLWPLLNWLTNEARPREGGATPRS
jgi:hypothetical protein